MDDFANAPMSITEIRSDKDGNGAVWTPRDALVAALRQIDSGDLKPEALIIAVREASGELGTARTRYFNASPDVHVAFGVLQTTMFHMWAR